MEKKVTQRKITSKKEFIEALERERKRREVEKYKKAYIEKYSPKREV